MSPAATPVVVADRACYSTLTPLVLNGAGFTAGGRLQVTARWSTKGGGGGPAGEWTITADGAGRFADAADLPDIDTGSVRLTMTITDESRVAQGAPVAEQYASTTVTLVFFGAYFRPWYTDGPAPGRPGSADVLDVSGYIGSRSRTLFIHYVRGRRVIKTLPVGRLTGPCAALSTRLEQFGFQPVPKGTYKVLFDTSRAWPNDDVWSGYRRVVVGRPPHAPGRARRRGARLGDLLTDFMNRD